MKRSTKKRSFRWRGRGRTRGVASVEAAIALPTLVLILFGVLYVSRSISQKHQAENTARSCAWRYSATGCSQVPEGCGTFVHRVRNPVDVAGSVNSAGKRIGKDFESVYAAAEGGFDGLAASIVGAALGDVVTKAMQKDAQGKVDYSVSRQGIAKELDALTVTYQIPCNLKETTVAQIAKDAWKDAISSFYK